MHLRKPQDVILGLRASQRVRIEAVPRHGAPGKWRRKPLDRGRSQWCSEVDAASATTCSVKSCQDMTRLLFG